jgi:sugar phosphate isomerase/epimerase
MILGFPLEYQISPENIESLGPAFFGTGVFSAVELKYPVNTIGIDDSSAADYAQAVRTLLARYDLSVSLHIPTNLDCGATNAAVRRAVIGEIKKSIDFASAFNARILSIHGATIGTFDYPEKADTPVKLFLREEFLHKKQDALQATVDMLGEIGVYAQRYGSSVALENVLLQQEVILTPEDLLHVLDKVNLENVGALYDCGHSNRIGYDNARFVRELAHRLIHVHISDNDGTCDLHSPIGTGTIDFNAVFSELRNIDYSGSVIMEVIAKSPNDLLENALLVKRHISGSLNKNGD